MITATVQGYEIRVNIGTPHAYGTSASAHAYAPNSSDMAAGTPVITFHGYCPACIAAHLAARMMPWANMEDIAADLEQAGHACACPCECGECDECLEAEL